jgi:hypothetical protein
MNGKKGVFGGIPDLKTSLLDVVADFTIRIYIKGEYS